jgi:hypothetical protein
MTENYPNVDAFLAHHGVKGMHWGVRKAEEEAHSQRVSEYRKGSEAKAAGKAASSRQATAMRKSKSETPLRPKTAPTSASKEDQLVSRAVSQAYERATSPAVERYFSSAPAHSPSGNPAVDALLKRSLNQGANRIETAAGESFVKNLPPTIRLR